MIEDEPAFTASLKLRQVIFTQFNFRHVNRRAVLTGTGGGISEVYVSCSWQQLWGFSTPLHNLLLLLPHCFAHKNIFAIGLRKAAPQWLTAGFQELVQNSSAHPPLALNSAAVTLPRLYQCRIAVAAMAILCGNSVGVECIKFARMASSPRLTVDLQRHGERFILYFNHFLMLVCTSSACAVVYWGWIPHGILWMASFKAAGIQWIHRYCPSLLSQ